MVLNLHVTQVGEHIFVQNGMFEREESWEERIIVVFQLRNNQIKRMHRNTTSLSSFRGGESEADLTSAFYFIITASMHTYSRRIWRGGFHHGSNLMGFLSLLFLECECERQKRTGSMEREKKWGQSESNTQPFDLESNALPLRHALLVLSPNSPHFRDSSLSHQTKW